MGIIGLSLIGLYLFLMLFVMYYLLCSDSDLCPPDSKLGKFNVFLTTVVWQRAKSIFAKVFGQKSVKLVGDTVNWACWKPNPILQILYVTLVMGGYLLFVKDGFEYLPNKYLGWYHRYIPHIVIGITMWLFYHCSVVDPGIITFYHDKKTKATNLDNMKFYKSFPIDNMLYQQRTCKTCKIERPARSKHCSFCDVCVSRFDHHCPWINNCVGENNLRFFQIFLLATSLICAYCAYLSYYVLIYLMDEAHLFKDVWPDPVTGGRTAVPYAYLFHFAVSNGGLLFPLGLFCGIISIVVMVFLAYHLSLVVRNTTTNETYKWQDYHRFVRFWIEQQKIKQQEKLQDSTGVADAKDNKSESKVQQRKKGTAQSEGAEKVSQEILDIAKPIFEQDAKGKVIVKNIYDKGILGNFKEVYFPPSYR